MLIVVLLCLFDGVHELHEAGVEAVHFFACEFCAFWADEVVFDGSVEVGVFDVDPCALCGDVVVFDDGGVVGWVAVACVHAVSVCYWHGCLLN
ncbi:hypothetical protein EJ419_07360 [Alloscardovia theropitheci]|uniref:Uncharacterized protein n=1 Tax=Alloscardovia theropitheci TaxID=2496842 RepID=A0A4R0QZ00_9BIFI|nr:hypothetical protein [Alloscardovia theropitheci]TCD53776.1 hypothetical protein EJ419_07360 [Alloscardovia theropitheci]